MPSLIASRARPPKAGTPGRSKEKTPTLYWHRSPILIGGSALWVTIPHARDKGSALARCKGAAYGFGSPRYRRGCPQKMLQATSGTLSARYPAVPHEAEALRAALH